MKTKDGLFVVLAVVLVATTVFAGPYSGPLEGVEHDDPGITAWATGIDMHWPVGFVPEGDFSHSSAALGPAPGTPDDVVTFGNGGWAVLSFDVTIRNHDGPDLVVFENGFQEYQSGADEIFAELGFVEVSSDNVHFARFPSVSLTSAWPGETGLIDATDVYNLAGKHVNNDDYFTGEYYSGTPFDLADLESHALVLSGDVDLDDIHYVKIVDVYGHSDGTVTDDATSVINPDEGIPYAVDHVIFDPGNDAYGLTGFDLDAVGVIAPVTGDSNGDGKVDGADLALWQQNYDPLGANADNGWATGDWDLSGTVDGADLALWQQSYDPIGTGSFAASTVPEPGTLALIMLAFCPGSAVLFRKRRP